MRGTPRWQPAAHLVPSQARRRRPEGPFAGASAADTVPQRNCESNTTMRLPRRRGGQDRRPRRRQGVSKRATRRRCLREGEQPCREGAAQTVPTELTRTLSNLKWYSKQGESACCLRAGAERMWAPPQALVASTRRDGDYVVAVPRRPEPETPLRVFHPDLPNSRAR
mgnify:CR=1 FL=1